MFLIPFRMAILTIQLTHKPAHTGPVKTLEFPDNILIVGYGLAQDVTQVTKLGLDNHLGVFSKSGSTRFSVLKIINLRRESIM